jgi:hypothetical protein
MTSTSLRQLPCHLTLCSHAWLWEVEDFFLAEPNYPLWFLLSECCWCRALTLLFSLPALLKSLPIQEYRVYMTERLHRCSLSQLIWTSGILKIETLCKHIACHLFIRITLDLRGDLLLHNAILCADTAVVCHVSVSIFFFHSEEFNLELLSLLLCSHSHVRVCFTVP